MNSILEQELNTIQIFIDELSSSSSKKHKIDVLKKNNNKIIIEFLEFIYNKNKTTGISKKKWEAGELRNQIFIFNEANINNSLVLSSIYKILISENTGSNHIVDNMIIICSCIASLELKNVFKRIITKDFQLGIDSSTINKVFSKLIPEFKVMLANKLQDFIETKKCKGEISITEKIDGQRVLCFKQNESIVFFNGRSGIKIHGLTEIEKEISQIEGSFVLDGELVARGNFENNGIQFSETMKRSRIDGEKTGLDYLVFDILSHKEFELKESCLKHYERRKQLENFFDSNKHYNLQNVKLLPEIYQGEFNIKLIDDIAQDLIKNHGKEGIMINFSSEKYQFKRTWALLKYKFMDRYELKIQDFEEGEGRHKGRLGAFICNYKNSIIKVGSGLNDEQREFFWKNKTSLVGKIINVKANIETKTSNGCSLRFPIFESFKE